MSESVAKVSCETCKYSFTLGTGLHCRRNPPTGAVLVKNDADGKPKIDGCVSIWPVVGIDQWCGEFGPKPELLSS